MTSEKGEVWMRGPVAKIPPLLQPVAHALLQAREEVQDYTRGFPDSSLWVSPGVASVGFHLLHLTGILDRLFTYATGSQLTQQQLKYLESEGSQPANATVAGLTEAFYEQVNKALQQLEETNESTLAEARVLGRKQIPTTVGGLLFHTAEHTQRHVGQLLVTIRLLPLIKLP